MSSRYVSTGQAAKECSVTPDTILKWIRSGQLPARRTPGGHHRIDRRDLEQLLPLAATAPRTKAPRQSDPHFFYCWQYKGKGQLLAPCRDCVVYALRAQRCYEVTKVAPHVRHDKLLCDVSCEECDYYRQIHEQATNVLVVTDDDQLADKLRNDADQASFNLELADGAYACSAMVERFRPDFAVVDYALGAQLSWEITTRLTEDPRIPFVRIVFAGELSELPRDCRNVLFARLPKPFGIEDLAQCTLGASES
jgi:excisionase family DNA binding protein